MNDVLATTMFQAESGHNDVAITRLTGGLIRVKFRSMLALVMEDAEYRKLAQTFGKAEKALDEQTNMENDDEDKETAATVEALRKHVAKHLQSAGADQQLVSLVRRTAYEGPEVFFIITAFDEIVKDDEERAKSGKRFWEFHGQRVYDALVNMMTSMNKPIEFQRRVSIATKAVNSMAGSPDWMD